MAESRRTTRKPGRPSAGRSRPRGSARSAEAIERRNAQRERLAARTKALSEQKKRTRLTSRAVVLVMVIAVLAVSYASSLRAYIQQRSNIESLQSQIARAKAGVAEGTRQIERAKDPAYIAQEAKARFGYVQRGETPYVVIDGKGHALDRTASLANPSTVRQPAKPTWYDTAWQSMEIAGHPPTKVPAPANQIDAPKQDTGR